MRFIPILALLPALHAGTLYYTDFEHFPVGANNWAGTDGWLSSDTTSGAQSIDLDLDPTLALGKSATLGFSQPASTFVPVVRFFNYDHTATGLPGIEINTFIAIADSTNGRRDDFFITIYNTSGIPLASLRFDNQNPDATNTLSGIWREDGVSQFDTLVDFTRDQFFDLFITINLSANTWSADILGFPLFTDETFTSAATGSGINLGSLAFEWDLSATFPTGYGDNYLAIDELTVRSFPIGTDPFTVQGHRDPATGNVTLTWQAEFGFDYQVQYSSDLRNWSDTLPGSIFANVITDGPMSYTDTTTPSGTTQYYRVRRTESE